MAFAKKRKVDQENRQFKSDWIEQFCFILPDRANAKPTCLICMKTVAVSKAENLRRHFNAVHAASFNASYPSKSDQHLKNADSISLAIDSSCDRTDMEQLAVFVRFFDGKTFREELLCLLPLPGHATGEVIFNELTQFFEKHGLNVRKIVSVVTDGAPSMVGRHKGLVSRLSAVNPALQSFHCIIHKSVLCAKLSEEMREVMDTVTRLVNFVRESSSLQHRLFRALLEDVSAEHKDLLLHNNVRWLSKGRVLERVCDLRDELLSFLSSLQSKKAQDFHSFLSDNKVMADVIFLCDIMSHLNHLNLQLQGKNHTVADMYEAVDAFRSKLTLLEKDIQGRKLHFPRLREHCEKNEMQEDPAMRDFVLSLAENFRERFESSPKLSCDILLFLRQPFSVSADGEWTAEAKRLVPSLDEAALQMEVLEMAATDLLKAQHKDVGVSDFWINVVPQPRFQNTRAFAVLLLTMFPSTYICESSFSSMNAIKSQDRNRLSNTHLGQCLRIATTEYKPDIRKIASSRRSHFSH
ncbi:general transcription factor II-I repeat domain-containing protein 2B-like [Myripristis murdjan]|uniref:general transcription factor II-I repeat domain-containing protein 2B-like n=1 Tax=Myripristis murdjan TaxID=586833 RepID=UPI0011760033|nr:general transcription factor II-I repeat domain-containing protein 2B-like [Myripristis murdjan]